MRFTVGFDVGTSSLKGVLVDEDGRVVARASQSYPLSTPHRGWSEQAPEDWWEALVAVSRKLTAGGHVVSAIGLSGQMHGSVFLDTDGRPLRPAILWNDQRTDAECEEVIERTQGRIVEWTLNPPRTAFTATKILWVRKHQPHVYSATRQILLPKDYARYRLSGICATDVTDASGTCLFDVRRRRWSEEVLDMLDIPMAWLSPAVESVEVCARVGAEAAEATGIAAGTPIVGGGADQATAAIGNGVTAPGVLSITLGTSGVVYAQTKEVVADPSGCFHTFCHAVPDTWQVMAGVLCAGGSLAWYRDVLGLSGAAAAAATGEDSFDAICRGIEATRPGAEGLLFLPYLTGERSPHADPEARGCWFGLTTRHNRHHLARAVVEGVCFALRDLVEVALDLDVEVGEIRVAGGGARDVVWLQTLADVLGRPVRAALTPDASPYGAAALAMAAVTERNVAPLAAAWSRQGPEVEPNPQIVDAYSDQYEAFRALYPATRTLMHDLAALERRADEREAEVS